MYNLFEFGLLVYRAIMVRTLKKDEPTREIDKGVKNKFNWRWLEHNISVTVDGSVVQCKLGECIAKVDVPGKAECTWCKDIINYGSRGRVALSAHIESGKHKHQLKLRQTNYNIGRYTDKTEVTTSTSDSEPTFASRPTVGERVSQMQVRHRAIQFIKF